MDSTSAIEAALLAMGLNVHGKIINDPSHEDVVYIPVLVETDEFGRKKPSGKILAQVRNGLSEKGINARFIAIDQSAENPIEVGLRTSLISSFPEIVRSSYISSEKNPTVWMDYKVEPDNETKDKIRHHVGVYFANFNINEYIFSDSEDNLPTKMKVLQVIRGLAPVFIQEIHKEFVASGYVIPSGEWLNRRLDQLRRSGFLVRRSDGRYALSMSALQALGTHKSRRSPDILRLLALNRRC